MQSGPEASKTFFHRQPLFLRRSLDGILQVMADGVNFCEKVDKCLSPAAGAAVQMRKGVVRGDALIAASQKGVSCW